MLGVKLTSNKLKTKQNKTPNSRQTTLTGSRVTGATTSAQGQGRLTVKAPGAAGDARRLLMDWKVAAGTPAMVFTMTFPLTVPAGRDP